MRIERLKVEKSREVANVRLYGIQSYGEYNDYPQRVMEIVEQSITGQGCLDIYQKFVYGRGFTIVDFGKAVCNSRGETFDYVLGECAKDYAMFGGFALHINYNALGEGVSLCHFPFECLRLEALTEDKKIARKVAYHPDWGKRNTKLRPFKVEDIEWFNLFDNRKEVILREVEEAGGWNGYKGQILYFSNAGKAVYPTPIYSASLTDMSSEEGLSNITLRNARFNFLPSGMFIDKDNTANSDEQQAVKRKELNEFQGDTNAGKMLYINLLNGEEAPEFRSFVGENYDQAFRNSEERVPLRIGRAFHQPPVLRADDSANGFDTQRIKQAYNFYNSLTESEREKLSEAFRIVCTNFEHIVNPEGDFYILPKRYEVTETLAERLGANIDRVLEIISAESVDGERKRVVLREIYGIDDDIIDKLL